MTEENAQLSRTEQDPGAADENLPEEYLPAHHPLVRANLLRIIFNTLPVSEGVIVFGALICGFILYKEGAVLQTLITWVSMIIAVASTRLYLSYRYTNMRPSPAHIEVWRRAFDVLAVAMGLAWSAAIVVVAPPDSFLAVAYALIMLCAIGAGVAASLPAMPRSFLLFMASCYGPPIVTLVGFRPFTQQLLGGILLVMVLFLLFVARGLYRNFLQSTLLMLHNEKLVKELQKEMTQQQLVVNRLQESENRYHDLFDNASDLVFSVYADGTWDYANPACYMTLGCNVGQDQCLNIMDLLHPESRQALKALFSSDVTPEAHHLLELIFITQNGMTIHTEGSVSMEVLDGRPTKLRGIFRDVTYRKVLELDLQASEERYKNIIRNATDIIFTTDPQGHFTMVNDRACKVSGYAEEDLIGKHYLDLVHPAYQHEVQTYYQGQIAAGSSDMHYRFPILIKSGDTVWIDQNVSVVRNDGAPIRLEAISRDISDQLRTLDALRESEAYIRAILANMSEAIINIDREARIISVNPAVEKIFGYSENELLGKGLETLLPETPDCKYAEQITRFENTGSSDFIGRHMEATGLHKNGAAIDLMLCFNEVRVNWQVTYIGVLVDISERKKTFKQIVAAKEEADASRRAEERFIATVSHEIRTPMNAVSGFIDLLSRTLLDPAQSEYVQSLQLSSQRLLKIVNDLLEFKRIQAGKIEFSRHLFNLKDTLDGLLTVFSGQAEHKSINLEYSIHPDTPVELLGDEHRLSQILQNLVSNAIKYTSGGEVLIRVAPEHVEVRYTRLAFSVEDTGVGIPAEKLERLFDVYTQVEARRDARSGSGLGLSIFKSLVEMQGGSIDVRSTPGQGSVFAFTLDFGVGEQPLAAKKADDYGARLAAMGRINLLLVDDDGMNIFIALKYLEPCENIHVQTADNGEMALEVFGKDDYDIVLTDANMPLLDGYSLAKKIRSVCNPARSVVPIILLTAETPSPELLDKVGINDCLMKPFTRDALYQILCRTLDSRTVVHETGVNSARSA